jgi:DNA topoisomerase-1
METHFEPLVDYDFTAQMEDFLDTISRQEAESLQYLKRFYFGDEAEPTGDEKAAIGLKPRLESKIEEIDPRVTAKFSLGIPTEGENREEVFVRVGKYGPFLEQGERKAPILDGMAPDEMTLARAMELFEDAAREDEPLGVHPETGKPIYIKAGRFGPYVQMGEKDDEEKKNASILKTIAVEDVDLEMACKLLSLPRDLGEHPEMKEPILAHDGRYGPYVKCGKETRSLPADKSPLDVTFDEAIELLKQPKTRGRAAPKEPIKKVEKPSPVTENEIKILEGRFGPYATDGETNASIPRGTDPKEMTYEGVLDLLAERAAKGPTKKKKKKKAVKKKTAKKAAKKKTAKKKAAKKKTAKAAAKKKGIIKKSS